VCSSDLPKTPKPHQKRSIKGLMQIKLIIIKYKWKLEIKETERKRRRR
jgi:hypothetical protein